MNFDAIAPVYRFCEYLAFGARLQRHRIRFLQAAKDRHHALILGDGDGRFSQALLHRYPNLRADSLDLSRHMLALASRRLQGVQAGLVSLIEADARVAPFPAPSYDLFATHFFLDCFSADELEKLVAKIAAHATPGALWMLSEFRKPAGFWRGLHAELWLQTMYFFFRIAAGLKTRKLPAYRPLLHAKGFRLIAEHSSMFQFVSSELWQFN